MDPFTEKDLIDCMKSIAGSLKEIKIQLEDLTEAVREVGAEFVEEGVEDGIEIFSQDPNDPDEGEEDDEDLEESSKKKILDLSDEDEDKDLEL